MRFMILHLSVVALLAMLGNWFLMFVIWRGNAVAKHKISPVQLLLLHTATADLLFAFLTLGTEIPIILANPYFSPPDVVCKIVRYLQALPLYASPFLLVALSVDRYQAICRPLVHYRSDRYRRPNLLGFTAWALALLCAAPQLFVWQKVPLTPDEQFQLLMRNFTQRVEAECRPIYSRSPNYNEASGDWQRNELLRSAYVLSFSFLAWLLPSLISAVFYFKVCMTVWRSNSNACRLNHIAANGGGGGANESESLNGGGAAAGGGTGSPSQSQEQSHINANTRNYVNGLRKTSAGFRNQTSEFERKRIQAVRLTLTIITCNFLLWAPYCIANVVQALSRNLFGGKVLLLALMLGNLNSCGNPLIYIFFNRQIAKRALSSLLPKKCKAESLAGARRCSSPKHTSTLIRCSHSAVVATTGPNDQSTPSSEAYIITISRDSK